MHNIQQWLFLSRGAKITPADNLGIEGWKLNILTEKNKLAPSQHAVTCVFDMHRGVDKFWSEYLFLSEMTPSENKIYKTKKMPFPLMIDKSTVQKYQLEVIDPSDSKNKYTSPPFYKKDAKKRYQLDEEFRNWFDFAVKLSSHYRITSGMFQEDSMPNTPTLEDIEPPVDDTPDYEQIVEPVPDEPEEVNSSYESAF